MNAITGLSGILVLFLVTGCAVGFSHRRHFSVRWLVVAALLVVLNDILLTRAYGVFPNLLPGSWNWQGKILALLATLVLASLPYFGWRRIGLTLRQHKDSVRPALLVMGVYIAFFIVLALIFPHEGASAETVAFQLTMPGLEEEIFYRGLLLYALDRAFTARVHVLGVEWGWGALFSSALFGLAHAFGYSDGGFYFEPMIMALTAIPSLLVVWLRLRTGSLLMPIILHNVGNSVFLIL